MGSIAEFMAEAAHNRAIQLLVHTDGEGKILDTSGEVPAQRAQQLAEQLDVVRGAIGALGEPLALGRLKTSLIFYEDGFLVIGSSPQGENVAVMAKDGGVAGLMLAQLRNALGEME